MRFDLTSKVTTAAASYDLASLGVVKDELKQAGGASDATLARYIRYASAEVAQYCNRVFPVESLTDTFTPRLRGFVGSVPNLAPLILSRFPVTAIAALTEGGLALVQDTDYRLDADAGTLSRLDASGYRISWPRLVIAVSYSAGYASIPADLEDATVRMVTKRWSSRGRDATLKQETIPGVSERQWWIASGNEAGNLTPDIVDVLDNYRVPIQV